MAIEKNTPNTLRHGKQSFTTLINETINSIRNPAALGFYTLLASKPEGWQIVDKYLMNHFQVGRDFCRKAMKYLKELGLLEIIAIRGDDGRIIAWETTLHVHITENPHSGGSCQNNEQSTLLKNQNVVKPESGETAPINKRVIQIKEKEEIKDFKNTCALSCTSDSFDLFWKLYPKKKDKKKCQAIWKRRKLDSQIEVILERLKNQIDNDREWLEGYAPHPLKYINGDKWDDDIAKEKPNLKKEAEDKLRLENEERMKIHEKLKQAEVENRFKKPLQYKVDANNYEIITQAIFNPDHSKKNVESIPEETKRFFKDFVKGVKEHKNA